MTDYQIALVAGAALLLIGSLTYLRNLMMGGSTLFPLGLTVAGGAALVLAENASPFGVRINDVFPALIDLAGMVKRSFL